MAIKIFTDTQLRSIKSYAELAMNTAVTIYRRNVDLGLDLTDDPYGSSVDVTEEVMPVGGALVWLRHPKNVTIPGVDAGMATISGTWEMWARLDVDIRPGDHVKLTDGTEFVVSDTSVGETWPAYLGCSMRLKE